MQIVSFIILGIMAIVFFTSLNFYDTKYELLNYPIRAFYHANISHLVANAISFFSLSFIENVLGSVQFTIAMVFIWIVSSIILYIIHRIFPSRKKYTVGFSGVIFGLMVIYYFLLNKSPGITLVGLIVSILPQVIVPGISFEGHLSGIIAGFIYVFLFGLNKKNPSAIKNIGI